MDNTMLLPTLNTKVDPTRKALCGMESQNTKTRFFDNSMLDTFRVCPRKFYFNHIRFFQPAGLRPPLIFGTSWHAAMDYVWANCNENKVDLLKNSMIAFLKEWKASGIETMEEFDLFPRTPGKAMSMLEEYIDRYQIQLQQQELIAVESPFIVPLDMEDETICYIGKLDKVYRDRYGIWICDHKTASSMTNTWLNSFSPSGQMDGYLHAGHMTWGDEFHGVLIDGALVNKTKIDFARIPLQRQESQLNAWLWEVVDLIDMIELNEERLIKYREQPERQDYLPAFPKCTTSCTQYFGTCQYLDLCKFWDNPDHHECPDHMVVKKWEPFTILEGLDGAFKVIENERAD